jgi:hypothetical protein
MAAHGYNWNILYAGRHGAITEMNGHTKGNVQTASHLFGHTPEVEAKNYVHGVPAEVRLAGVGARLNDYKRQTRNSAGNDDRK